MLFEQLWSNPWLWIGIFIVLLVITRGRYVFWIIGGLTILWYIGNAWGIVLDNIVKFPRNLMDDLLSFFGSFYDPNEGILENIFYNDWIWIILFIILLTATRGKSIGLILGYLFVLWLLGNLIILSLGIKIFFVIALISTLIAMFFFSRNRNASTSNSRDKN